METRQADKEVTREMVSAGASLISDALLGEPFEPDLNDLARRVYIAMARLAQGSKAP